MRYVLATQAMAPGSALSNDQALDGATLPLREIPLGTVIHNIECIPGRGGQLVKAAGTFATLVGKELDGVRGSVRLPSGSVKRLLLGCRATVGRVGNEEWQNRVLGRAGRVRRLGRRPKVRGVAMNAVDHPHGGGKGGRGKGKPSQSLWGWTCK
jgi:large subunit ribosomal protein L2